MPQLELQFKLAQVLVPLRRGCPHASHDEHQRGDARSHNDAADVVVVAILALGRRQLENHGSRRGRGAIGGVALDSLHGYGEARRVASALQPGGACYTLRAVLSRRLITA